jgi:sugar lactone lactonase YvrE
MRDKLAKTKFKSVLGGTGPLFNRLVGLAAVVLICSSARAQNLFVADGNIYEFTSNGVRSTFASGFTGPSSLAFDRTGNLFVADVSVDSNSRTSGTIYKFTPAGVRSTFALGLNNPLGLAFDGAGNLFVSDDGDGTIYKFTPQGARSTFASGLSTLSGLAFDSVGNLFVSADYDAFTQGVAKVYEFTPQGVRTTFASGFTGPWSLAFDNAGNLWVADVGDIDGLGTAIYRVTPQGKKSTFVSWPQDQIVLNGGLAFDSAGNLFVTDYFSGILKFTPTGVRSTFASGGGSSLAFQPTQIPTATFANISTRGSVETGENVLISGFIVSGSDSKQVIIRGLGPTLTSFGVPGALQDSVLELHNTNSMMSSNDDWQSAANANQIPMNYRPANSRESAIMTTLQPGTYTTVMHGKDSTTGIGLLEVYSTLSGLTNVSTRGFVGTGDHVLIGGFISSGGNGSLPVIIRALGPTLTQFGVSGALADPTLALVDGNGNVVASNDNWKNTQQTAIQNSGFAPPNDLESAISATLTNGNYTAIVSGKNGTTGVSLLEVYKVALATSSHDF